ncbi:hypothetical protein BDM02DRAFT_3182742 [Thelephora ganbajun]|uniref:Uncharacterized protein n=1 Tax=Thelephora ganbajun TaxID=370292 RepID=A0ACB6ZVR0_THEGA|nr:hypothetical protein BDM02DRAFT_3182742 [Thelephora ganbajun]
MPGPGARNNKQRSKKDVQSNPSVSPTPSTFVADMDNAEDWNLDTRSGLKKVHVDFPDIYRRLSGLYEANPQSDNIIGGIVGIFAQMYDGVYLNLSVDGTKAYLRTRLVQFPLLEKKHTRHMALVALATITHNGGSKVRTEIAKHTPILTRLMREKKYDAKLLELAIITISHAIQAVLLDPGKPPDPKLLKLIGLKDTLDVVLESIRYPWISALAVTHAVPLLGSPTLHCWDVALKHADVLNFLAACLRCEDLSVRCDAMSAFFNLHHHDAKDDATTLDPRRVIESYEKGAFKKNRIEDAIVDYGFQDTDTFNTVLAAGTFQSAMQKAVETRNLVDLGRTLARLVTQTEFSIADGYYQTINERTGKMEAANTGLPFTRWRDALPHCVEALQETGYASDTDMADILQIKYLIMMRKLDEAILRAKAATERSPQTPYFYYPMTLKANMEEGLRYAKKGMKCRTTTKFVHFRMMKRAIEFAGDLGINAVVTQPEGGGKELGVAFLTSAMEDAKDFIANAPPDSRHMQEVVDWYMLMTITLKGPELHMSLVDFQPVLDKRDLAVEFLRITGVPPQESQAVLALRSLLQHMNVGNLEWGPPMMKINQLLANEWDYKHKNNPVPENVERRMDELTAWLEKLDIDPAESKQTHCVNPKVNPNRVVLYRCTHCGTPSAVLRRCKCGKVR